MPEIFDATAKHQPSAKKKKPTHSEEPMTKSSSPNTQTSKPSNLPPKTNSQKTNSDHHKANGYSETIKKEEPTSNPLIAFAPKPENVGFDSQLKNEEVVLMLRMHPITQLGKALIALIASFIPILIFSSPFLDFMPFRFKLATFVGWYLLLATYTIETFLTWFFNVFILTDERVIDVDFITLIYKNVSSAKIENIEDITVATGGV
ncbi:MAG: hypothetical protein GF381_02505, partial [Candidatus Pacebacteria bacterium]|nr:hypothetical protein [Candidatus Paceibacterota bacterium]